MNRPPDAPRIGLFVTCLVDMFRPSVGHAAACLIEEAGCTVEAPLVQNCCGRPAQSGGDADEFRATAERTIAAFEGYDHVVAPSAACASLLQTAYPKIFAGDVAWSSRASAFSAKVHELVAFLTHVMKLDRVTAVHHGAVAYHGSCAGPSAASAKALLSAMEGLELKEIDDARGCCGSCPGTPAMPRVAVNALAERKLAAIEASGVSMVLGDDIGCLMGLAGRLRRKGSHVTARHVAEVLAGMTDQPPIGITSKAA